MLQNYFKIAWRGLVKSKAFSIINIVGLTVGLTSFLLIALYVFDELTFDRFHTNAANIYRVVEHRKTAAGKETKTAGAGYQVSEKAKITLPEIRDAARILYLGRTNVGTTENTNVFYEDYTIANPGFLTTFDFVVTQGDRNTALTAPHSVIVTEETAGKLFHTTRVLGKTLKVDADSTPFTITAVLKDFPVNSHLSFHLLFSESSLNNSAFRKFVNTDWHSGSFNTYLLLRQNTNPVAVEAKINQLVAANETAETKDRGWYILQPLQKVHFYSGEIEGNSGKKGNISYIYVFCILAIFVLSIACINYINLTTARFTNRAKEVAVRKVAGATRKNLVAQFLSEAFLITLIAFCCSLLLVKMLLPYFNAFTEKQLTLGSATDLRIWIGLAILAIFVALLSGVYPALYQANAKPLLLLKSKLIPGKGNLSLRRSLVVFQFAISIVMIVATMIVYKQMKYVNTKDMGFNKDQLLVIDINSGKVRKSAETIKTTFLKLPQVKDVTVSSRVPGEWKDLPVVKVRNEKIQTAEGEEMYFVGVDDRFLETYQISLVKGRNFLPGSNGDSSAVILNETAAKALGIKAPSEQRIEIPLNKVFTARVVGIVKDFNFQSLRQPMAPMVLGYQENPIQNIDYFSIRVTPHTMTTTLNQMDGVLHSIDQNHLFEYHFLDKQWDLFYREDQIRQTIFLVVAILTIAIACMGLFGLATFAAEQRIKEIGIRRVLGASVGGIVTMLSTDFLKLVIIASVIAFPVAWIATNKWLADFAYRITVSWWIFAASALFALVIALLTVSFKAIKAAAANPVKSLRTE